MKLELLTHCVFSCSCSHWWKSWPSLLKPQSLHSIIKSVSQKTYISFCSHRNGEPVERDSEGLVIESQVMHMIMVMITKHWFSFSSLKNAKSIISTTCWKKTNWPLLQQWQLYRLCWEARPHFTNWEFCWQITTCIFVMFYQSETYRASVFKVRTCLMAFSLSGEQTQPHSSECGEEVPGRLRLSCRQCVRSW